MLRRKIQLKIRMMERTTNNDLVKAKKSIRKYVSRYILGCFLFLVMAFGFVWLGVLKFNGHDLPDSFVIFLIIGLSLIFDMVGAMCHTSSLPDDFKEIREKDFPQLFVLIDEVRKDLKAERIRHVYVCPDAFAAIFVLSGIKNLFRSSEKSLVIGLAFLTQMSDDELRAILYHEYAHYLKGDLSSSEAIYRVGQFSKGFLSVKDKPASGTWATLIKSLTSLFSFYTLSICEKIRDAYKGLNASMEQTADEIAARYIPAFILQNALVHASCLEFEYRFLQWGQKRLKEDGIALSNPYDALRICFEILRPHSASLRGSALQRVQRLGEHSGFASKSGYGVRDSLPEMLIPVSNNEGFEVCDASDFAQWLKDGLQEYEYQVALRKSVLIEINLDRKKHKLPWVDSLYQIVLDGKSIGKGNYIKGFSLKKRIGPGKHTLTFHAPAGIKPFPYSFETEAGKSYFIEIDHRPHLNTGIYDLFVDRFETVDNSINKA